ncbi:expressed unknown protein [Seminavis robusta]|uniref:Uncharacterized protein n=1 Tax=Seminavis robusta TaxID=568900 RepID=A0A9N8ETI8_9STRA|nr:expressed unknown protein [Seminavis robusta]|eukprot:Sro1775_g296880.1 n/a (209) ;mRNA; f:19874-20500
MSDLAPFVAAALKDKVVAELLEENRRLKRQVDSFQRVRITGKNGFPVYAEHDFALGKPTDHGWWVVRLPTAATTVSPLVEPIPCPMSQLADCEVHVGNFRNMTCRDFQDCFFDGNPKGYFSLFATKGLWLCCYLDGVSDPHYRALCRAAATQETVHEILRTHFDDPMEDLNVYFTHLTFCGGSASEAIRHLELLPEQPHAHAQEDASL